MSDTPQLPIIDGPQAIVMLREFAATCDRHVGSMNLTSESATATMTLAGAVLAKSAIESDADERRHLIVALNWLIERADLERKAQATSGRAPAVAPDEGVDVRPAVEALVQQLTEERPGAWIQVSEISDSAEGTPGQIVRALNEMLDDGTLQRQLVGGSKVRYEVRCTSR